MNERSQDCQIRETAISKYTPTNLMLQLMQRSLSSSLGRSTITSSGGDDFPL